jgi:magnesium transporter
MTGNLLRRVGMERVSLFLGKSWVISIEDVPGDTFDVVIRRLERRESRLRKNKPDLLFHALVDALVDRFFPVIDKLSRILDTIDREVSAGTATNAERRLHRTRKKIYRLREVVWPMKEAVGNLMVDDTARIAESTRRYFRDASDHLLQVIEHLDSLRELATSIRDVHYSQLNARMNEIMRNLAVLSAVFMPMAFIVGVYGMNFERMPELRYENGYYICLAVIAAIGVAFWYWFKRKKWIDISNAP